MSWGVMTTPSLATPADTIAICSGVARTSNCPSEDCAVCGALRSLGNVDGVTCRGIDRSAPNPNFRACSSRASPPRSMPSFAKDVLQETTSDCWSVTVSPEPHAPPPELRIVALVSGRSSSAGPCSSESFV